MTEREVLLDAIFVSRMHCCGAGQSAAAFRIFRLEQMAFASARTQYFAAGRNFETFGHGLLRFNPFWASHKFNPISSKRARNIRRPDGGSKGYFQQNRLLNGSPRTAAIKLHPPPDVDGYGAICLRSCWRANRFPSFWVSPKAWQKGCPTPWSHNR